MSPHATPPETANTAACVFETVDSGHTGQTDKVADSCSQEKVTEVEKDSESTEEVQAVGRPGGDYGPVLEGSEAKDIAGSQVSLDWQQPSTGGCGVVFRMQPRSGHKRMPRCTRWCQHVVISGLTVQNRRD